MKQKHYRSKKIGLSYIDIINELRKGNKKVEQLYDIRYIPAPPCKEHIVFNEGKFGMEGNTINPTPSSFEFDRIVKIPSFYSYLNCDSWDPIELGTTVIVHTELTAENITFKYKDFTKAQFEFDKLFLASSDRECKKKDICDEKVHIMSQSHNVYFMNLFAVSVNYEKQEAEFVIDYYLEKI